MTLITQMGVICITLLKSTLKLLVNAIHALKQHHSLPHSLRIALPPLSYRAPLLQSIWSVVAAAAGTVRSACQTEIHVPGMSPGGLSNSVRFIVKSLSL